MFKWLTIFFGLTIPAMAGPQTFYVQSENSVAARDNSDAPWPGVWFRTLEQVNQHVFHDGDKVLFRSGETFEGCLHITRDNIKASMSNPVVFRASGSEYATIYCAKDDGIFIETDVNGLIVEHLQFIGDPLGCTPGNGVAC